MKGGGEVAGRWVGSVFMCSWQLLHRRCGTYSPDVHWSSRTNLIVDASYLDTLTYWDIENTGDSWRSKEARKGVCAWRGWSSSQLWTRGVLWRPRATIFPDELDGTGSGDAWRPWSKAPD